MTVTTDEDDECKHGLDPRWCSLCLQHGPAKPEPVEVVAVFRARYDGDCPACDLPIRPGEMAAKLSNERTVHKWCT